MSAKEYRQREMKRKCNRITLHLARSTDCLGKNRTNTYIRPQPASRLYQPKYPLLYWTRIGSRHLLCHFAFLIGLRVQLLQIPLSHSAHNQPHDSAYVKVRANTNDISDGIIKSVTINSGFITDRDWYKLVPQCKDKNYFPCNERNIYTLLVSPHPTKESFK